MELSKRSLDSLIPEGGKLIRYTASVCPVCAEEHKYEKMVIPAVIYEKDGKVWIAKKCKEHGIVKDLYWGSVELYRKMEKYASSGVKPENPHVKKRNIKCPLDCGLCHAHLSHTALLNIVATNRCDLSCWYCFYYAREGGYVYEPTLEEIRFMLRTARNQKPIPVNAVQITGGEPTVRDDIVDIVRIAREEGYEHIQFNTNGIRFSYDFELVKEIKEAGANVVYMSFDGVTSKTNPKNYWEILDAIDNCRKVGLGIVLVPTVIGGYNDHEVGDMIRFAAANIDIVRSVNFQPISIVGRVPRKERMKMRITIPDLLEKIAEQTDNQITPEDWFTVPASAVVSKFISALKGEPKYTLSNHFACGIGTYVFRDGKKLIPFTRFMDIEDILNELEKYTRELQEAKIKLIKKANIILKVIRNLGKYIHEEKAPKGINVRKAIIAALTGGSYDSLRAFHHQSLFLGSMHFMDTYNYDVARVVRCNIHYGLPDGRVIPFCTFNVLSDMYREEGQKAFSIPAEEWEKKTGRKLKEDKYHRKISKEKRKRIEERYKKILNEMK